jgi:hypothetical protein
MGGITNTGAGMGVLFDQDIAHIARVMAPSLVGDFNLPILQAAYWRARLHKLLDETHLTHAQLCALDSLLLQLDEIEAKGRPMLAGSTFRCRSKARQFRVRRGNPESR